MAPVKLGKYSFIPNSLVEIRERLGFTQAKMAQIIGVPANTLSRWETGATTPDAHSLAAIYSAASEHDITAIFFQRRRPMSKPSQQRSRLLTMWDFQNVSVSESDVAKVNSWIKKELEKKFPGTSYKRFKAFSSPSQSSTADELQNLGWRVFEDDYDIDDEIINQARSDCGQEPKDTVLVLITKDGDFAGLVEDLKREGVVIYLISPSSGYKQGLVQAVGDKHWIRFPYAN